MLGIRLEAELARRLDWLARVDKVQTLRRDRVRERVGVLAPLQMQGVDAALRLWLRV